MAAVCGFEVEINNQTTVGVVKEQNDAMDTYDDAIASGQNAFKMDEGKWKILYFMPSSSLFLILHFKEQPDVFVTSLGNVPPDASVKIKYSFSFLFYLNSFLQNYLCSRATK